MNCPEVCGGQPGQMHKAGQKLDMCLPEVGIWGRQLKGNINKSGEGTGVALFCQIISQSLQQHRPVSVAGRSTVMAPRQQYGALAAHAAKLTAEEVSAAHDHAWGAVAGLNVCRMCRPHTALQESGK